ncbi:GDSL-type esterase/lipase family protein [Candidatus Neomarinimicrobiota bacterium]
MRVACVGNSITVGVWLSNPAEDSYPAVLGGLLGSDYDVRNFGSSGSTVLKNGDLPYWETSSYQSALEFSPDIVVILLGTNDSTPENWVFSDEFEADYVALIESFKIENADAELILCYPPPILSDPDSEANLINELIPKISAVGNQTGSRVLNLYESFEGHSELYHDGVHPNKDGHQVIANLVYQMITASSMTLGGTGNPATSAHMTITESGGEYAYYCVDTETVDSGASKTVWDAGAYCGGGTSTASVETEEAYPIDTNPQDKNELSKTHMLPDTFGISQNYPNPFNPITTIRYQLPEESHVIISVYNIMGRQVVQLINATQAPGYKSVQWNSKDQFGQSVSAGMYIYHIQAGSYNKTMKMVLLK